LWSSIAFFHHAFSASLVPVDGMMIRLLSLGFSWWWWQQDYLQRTEASQEHERGLDFPSNMNENVKLQGIALVPLGPKVGPGPWM